MTPEESPTVRHLLHEAIPRDRPDPDAYLE